MISPTVILNPVSSLFRTWVLVRRGREEGRKVVKATIWPKTRVADVVLLIIQLKHVLVYLKTVLVV